MKLSTTAAVLAAPAVAGLILLSAGPAGAASFHTSDSQLRSFSDPCHADAAGTLALTYKQVQLTPDNQFRQIETGEFTFTPDNPQSPVAAGHFVDQQYFATSDTPGSATLTESIHAVAHYSDGTRNPVQLTTVTNFVNFAAVNTQVVKAVCGS
jgi:hypothetical protein